MRNLLISILLLGIVALTGCAGIESTIQADLQKVSAIAVPDLQAALADATAHGDTAASNCYTTLLAVIQSNPIHMPTIKGVASAFQAGRDAIGGTGVNEIAKRINIGCAALFVDANFALAKLVGTMGVGGLPALPLP